MAKPYKEVKDSDGNERTCIIRVSDNSFIPCDPMNSDYQEFLEEKKEKGESAILETLDS